MKDNYSKYIVDDMKRILFELVKNKETKEPFAYEDGIDVIKLK